MAQHGGERSAEPCTTWGVEVCTDIGGRPRQEDRYFFDPDIPVRGSQTVRAAFFGVWDGTVDQHASDYVHTRCCRHHLSSAGFRAYEDAVAMGQGDPEVLARYLAQATREGYAAADEDLLASCRALRNHYSSSTSVTAIIASGILTVGHLGDSRCYLLVRGPPGSERGRGMGLRGHQLTEDHKPDNPEERRRIEQNGGSIQLLHHHHNKPFIRGGDFDRRKAAGERAMQLQYSRAFGGKDLKPFGLSAAPGVRQLAITDDHVGMVLCSDGISDVANADTCAALVGDAWQRGEDAAAALVSFAIQERARVGIGADNTTALVIRFTHGGGKNGR